MGFIPHTRGLAALRVMTVLALICAMVGQGVSRAAQTYTVNTTVDTEDSNLSDGICADALGRCSLRAAIQQSNVMPGNDVVVFAITGLSPFRIRVTSELPVVTEPITIDGTTQAGYQGTPLIVLDGGATSTTQIGPIVIVDVGLDIAAGGSLVKGLTIEGFSGVGILLRGAGENRVESNLLRANGDAGTFGAGLIIDSSSNNLISGNISQANTWDGIQINDGATGNRLAGNTVHSNGVVGIRLTSAPSNTIGGTESGSANTVHSNGGNGIRIENPDGGANLVLGNTIGPSSFSGVTIVQSPGNLVGGSTPGAANYIFGNVFFGVAIALDGAVNNRVEGNVIGLDRNGSRSGNGSNFDNSAGIVIEGASANTVGGTLPGARNVISGNNGDGIHIFSNGNDPGSTSENRVLGNWIGLNVSGTSTIGNTRSGVQLVGGGGGIIVQPSNTGASQNIIGGLDPASRNVISGNGYGVGLGALPDRAMSGGFVNENLVIGNYIGTDPTGTLDMGNTFDGVNTNGSSRNVIGGIVPEARNVISGNGRHGVSIGGPGLGSQNRVLGNFIGTKADGVSPLKNDSFGVRVGDVESPVGDTSSGAGNVIAFNGGGGVVLPFNASMRVPIRGNSIHSNGGLGIDLNADGVTQNDPGDSDFGANGRQNFPKIVAASTTFTQTRVQGSLLTSPGEYSVDIYSSPDCDSSGFGEGATFVGSANVIVDNTGQGLFDVSFDRVIPSSYLTASATDIRGSTSEFSSCFALDPAELSITLQDSPDPVLAGQQLSYQAGVFNSGPNTATAVMLTDVLPSSVIPVSVVSSQGNCVLAQTVTCELGAIENGASASVAINVKVKGTAPSTISNTASVKAAESQANRSNDSATATTSVNAAADLALTMSDSPDPVVAGAQLTYTIGAQNRGPNNATNVTVRDALPAGVSFVSASASQGTCSFAGGVVNCLLGTIAGSETLFGTASVTIRVVPQSPGTLSNSAQINADQGDPDAANNTAAATTMVKPGADLAVTVEDAPDPVVAGAELTYTTRVTNQGPNEGSGSTLTQTLPSTVDAVSFEPSQGECLLAGTLLTCSLGSIPIGGIATVVTKVTPRASGSISTSVAVDAVEDDPDPSDNSASAATTVAPGADLEVTQTDSPDPVLAGSEVTYEVKVRNSGPDSASNVELVDTLPTDVTFISAETSQGSCTSSSGLVTCRLGSIGTSAGATVLIRVRAPLAEGTLINRASANADQADPDPSDNVSTEETTVNPSADLSITQTDTPDPARTGGSLTYTITVSNSGPNDATGVRLDDILPEGAVLVSVEASQGTCNSTVVCELGTLPVGGSVTVRITVRPTIEGLAVNRASVAAIEGDVNPANNSSAEQTTVIRGVLIDVRPGNEDNRVKAIANESIPVAILTEGDFNAAMIDPATVCFGDAEDASQRDCTEAHVTGHIEDVDGDGDLDLLLHYEFPQTGIDFGDTEACLTGRTLEGRRFEGCDRVRVT